MASWTGVSLHIFSSFIHKALCLCTQVASPTSSTSSKQATSLSDGCSYWSSGDTTGWDIMCQSDSNMCIYTLCLTTTQPKSFFIYLRQKPSPGDPLLFFCFFTDSTGILWRGSSAPEQPQADLGQAVANARCHARMWPVEKGKPCHVFRQ